MIETILTALFIACCRIFDVSIGTIRTILVVHGRKYFAALAGFIEVFIWITLMSIIVKKLDNYINLIAYASGFALGNLIGITLEEKISLGYVNVTIFSPNYYKTIIDHLKNLGYGITTMPAHGINNNYEVITTIIQRKKQNEVIKEIEKIDPYCFYTIEFSKPKRGYFQAGQK